MICFYQLVIFLVITQILIDNKPSKLRKIETIGENNENISDVFGCASVIKCVKKVCNPPPILFISLEDEIVRYCLSREDMDLSSNLILGGCQYKLLALTLR